jgi:RpiB/LacA/LacB family sugar-phosphate isomerase
MIVYFGADHGGYRLKEILKVFVKNQGYEVFDIGSSRYEDGDDYPDFAVPVAKKINVDPERSRGILICRSGAGVDMVANKFKNVRSVLAISPDQVYAARHDDAANVLSLAADYTSDDDARKITTVFLETKFADEEKYRRRLNKISDVENA